MLTISDRQMRVLDTVPRHEFRTLVIRHLQRFYPRECRLAGDAHMHSFVELGFERASRHTCVSRQTATLYIQLMLMLGSQFDEDPQIPWAAAEFEHGPLTDARSLLDGVFDQAVGYLDQIAGDGNQRIVRAMLRLRQHDFHAAVRASPTDSFDDALWALLLRLYPEKAECQGRQATMALVQQALDKAHAYALRGDQALAHYCVLAFMLGSGFDDDPLYGWAQQILMDTALAHDQKFERLLSRSLAYLEDSLRD